jgi:hypothetical protein
MKKQSEEQNSVNYTILGAFCITTADVLMFHRKENEKTEAELCQAQLNCNMLPLKKILIHK